MAKYAENSVDFESRISTLLLFGGLLVCVVVLGWHSIFRLQPEIEGQSITIDSLKAKVIERDSQLVNLMKQVLRTDSIRTSIDKERIRALKAWKLERDMDDIRKQKYDKSYPQLAPGKQ